MNADTPTPNTAAEQKPSAGELLKQGRLRQRLALSDCAKRTHISARYLEALEENRWNDLPSESHRQGFLGLYARFLGVPYDEVMASYHRGTLAQGAVPATKSQNEKERDHSYSEKESRQAWFPRGWPQIVGLAILILALVWIVYHQVHRLLPQENALPIVRDRPQQTRLIPPTQTISQHRIRLQAQGDTWLRVVADGQMLYEGILPAGSIKEWSRSTGFQIKIGNVQAVTLSWNDQPVDIHSGARAGIKDVKIPLEK